MLKIEHDIKSESLCALKAIVRLIYDTDPYIYPAMFDDYEDFESAFLNLITDEHSIFFIGRMYIAYEEEQPVGLLLPFKKGEGAAPVFGVGEQYANLVVEEVFKKSMRYLEDKENTIYINNVCVSVKKRGSGIGGALLREFIANCGNEKIVLDCLRYNQAAVKLYLSYGFEIKEYTNGFAGRNESPVAVVWMERDADIK